MSLPPPAPPPGIILRQEARPEDVAAVEGIVASTGFFNPEEVGIARELVEERLRHGDASGYHFVFAERERRVVGYTCWGHIAGTRMSYDLFWIAVHDDFRGAGLGRYLMGVTESIIARRGGGRIYAETSSRDQYLTTRRFYESCGYLAETVNTDFYAPGDSKVTYVKVVPPFSPE